MDIEALQTAIIDEFIRQFNEVGPRVTLDSVCKAIHISKKTIYKCFESKTAIFEMILSDALETVKDGQKAVASDDTLSIPEKLKAILTIPFPRQDELDLSRIPEFYAYDPSFYQQVLEAYRPNWGYVKGLIEKGKEEGCVRPDVHVDLVISMLMDCFRGLYEKDRLKNLGLTYTQACDRIVDTVLNGIFA